MAIKTLEVATDLIRFKDVASAEQFLDEVEAFLHERIASFRRNLNRPELAANFVAKYSHPDPRRVNRHVNTLYELFDKVHVLESVYATLLSEFGSMPKAKSMLDRVQSLLSSSKKRINTAIQALSACVEKHQPEFFQLCHYSLMRRFKLLQGCFDKLEPLCLSRVIVDKEGKVVGSQYSVYYQFTGVTDKTGFRHDKYFVVVSCLVDKFGRYSMNYCLQPTMLLPGRFRGSVFFGSALDGYEKIMKGLAAEGFDWSKPK